MESEILEKFDIGYILEEGMLPMIVVYKNPIDFPEKYVARLFRKYKATKYIMVKESLEEIRKEIPVFMVRFERAYTDELHILETWL